MGENAGWNFKIYRISFHEKLKRKRKGNFFEACVLCMCLIQMIRLRLKKKVCVRCKQSFEVLFNVGKGKNVIENKSYQKNRKYDHRKQTWKQPWRSRRQKMHLEWINLPRSICCLKEMCEVSHGLDSILWVWALEDFQ